MFDGCIICDSRRGDRRIRAYGFCGASGFLRAIRLGVRLEIGLRMGLRMSLDMRLGVSFGFRLIRFFWPGAGRKRLILVIELDFIIGGKGNSFVVVTVVIV